MKYIIYEDNTFALIPETTNHNSFNVKPVVSAGFCTIESFRNNYDDLCYKVSCYGESETLKVKSRGPEDAQIIKSGMK